MCREPEEMTGLTFFSGDVVRWSHSSLGLELLTSNPFSEFSSFHVGNKDLKPRTGSWRVLQILVTTNLAFWIGFFVLILSQQGSRSKLVGSQFLGLSVDCFSCPALFLANWISLFASLPSAPEKEFHTTVMIRG